MKLPLLNIQSGRKKKSLYQNTPEYSKGRCIELTALHWIGLDCKTETMKSWMMKVLILSITVSLVVASPNGPPVAYPNLCDNMVPGHGASDAMGEPPYTVTAMKGADNTYTVRLEGVNGSSTFRGFFLQARPWDSSSSSESQTASIGVFTSSATGTKPLDCFGSTGNAWGHSINTDKAAVEGTWTPPAGSGEVRFRVSVVKGPASTYWTDIYSDVVMYNSDTMTTGKMSEATSKTVTVKMTSAPIDVATTESSAGKARLTLATMIGSVAIVLLTSTRM